METTEQKIGNCNNTHKGFPYLVYAVPTLITNTFVFKSQRLDWLYNVWKSRMWWIIHKRHWIPSIVSESFWVSYKLILRGLALLIVLASLRCINKFLSSSMHMTGGQCIKKTFIRFTISIENLSWVNQLRTANVSITFLAIRLKLFWDNIAGHNSQKKTQFTFRSLIFDVEYMYVCSWVNSLETVSHRERQISLKHFS